MSEEGSGKRGNQGQWTDTRSGPTWMDAFSIAASLEKEFGLQVHFRVLSAAAAGRWSGRACRVCAIALRIRERPEDSVIGCASFGGGRGSATMPGAIVAALYELEERITDPEWAWQPPRYELS